MTHWVLSIRGLWAIVYSGDVGGMVNGFLGLGVSTERFVGVEKAMSFPGCGFFDSAAHTSQGTAPLRSVHVV